MSALLSTVLTPLALGFAFGWMLQKAGLTRYDRIANVFRFRDLAVLKFMLTAVIVGALATEWLVWLGWAAPIPVPRTYVAGNAIGGFLHGIGMALVGLCPGTIAAGVGEGSLDYLIGGVPGLFAGALLFGFTWPYFFPALATVGDYGTITLAGTFHVDAWLVAIFLAECALVLFYALGQRSTRRPSRNTPVG